MGPSGTTLSMGQAQGRPSKEPETQLPRTIQTDLSMNEELNVTISGFVCRSDTAADRPIKFKRPKLESLPCAVRVEICEVRLKSTTSTPSTNSDFLDARRLPCEIQQGFLELSNNEYEFRLQSFRPFRFDGRSLHLHHLTGSAKQPWKRSLATEYDVRFTILFQEQSHFARALQHVGLEVPIEESYLGARILFRTDSPRQMRYGRAYLLRSEATVSTHLELVTDIAWKRSTIPEGVSSTVAALSLNGSTAVLPLKPPDSVNDGAQPQDAAANQLDAETRIQKAWNIGLEALCSLFGSDRVLWNKDSFCDALARLAEMTTREDADKLLRQFYCSRRHIAFASEYSHCLRSAPSFDVSKNGHPQPKFKPATWYKDIELKDVEAAIAKRESERRKAAKFHQRNQSTIQDSIREKESGDFQNTKLHDKNISPVATKTKKQAGSALADITPGPPAKLRRKEVIPTFRYKAIVPETPESAEEKSETVRGTQLELSTNVVQGATKLNSDSAVELLDRLPARLHGVKLGAEPHDLSESENSTIFAGPARARRGRPRKAKVADSSKGRNPGASSSGGAKTPTSNDTRNDYGLPLPALKPYTVPMLDDPELSLFKSVTMRRLTPGSQVVEYDEQIDETWYRMKLDQKVESTITMVPTQKALMKRWNDQMLEEKLNGNKFLPAALMRFVMANDSWLAVMEHFQQFLRFCGELRRDKLVTDDTLQQLVDKIQPQASDPYITYFFKSDRSPNECRSEWATSCSCGEQIDDPSQSIICSSPDCKNPEYHMDCLALVARPADWLCRTCKILTWRETGVFVSEERVELFLCSFRRAVGRTFDNERHIEEVLGDINDSTAFDQAFTEAEVSHIMDDKGAIYDNYERAWNLSEDMFKRWGDE